MPAPMPDVPDWIARYTATRLGFPSWADERARPPRARLEPGRLLAGLGPRPGRRHLAAGERRAGRASRRCASCPTGGSPGSATTPARRPADGSRSRSRAATPEPLFPALPDGMVDGDGDGAHRARCRRARGRRRLPGPRGRARRHARGSSTGRTRPSASVAPGTRSEGGHLTRRAVPRPAAHATTATSCVPRCGCSTSTTATARSPRSTTGPGAWRPAPGPMTAPRYAFANERGRPHAPVGVGATATRRDLDVDLPGDVIPWRGTRTDGTCWCVTSSRHASQLHRLDTEDRDRRARRRPARRHRRGADLRPDGAVWLTRSDGTAPPARSDADGASVVDRARRPSAADGSRGQRRLGREPPRRPDPHVRRRRRTATGRSRSC